MKFLHRIKNQSGQVGLEVLATFGAWLFTASLMINLLFFFGSAMLMQASVNRAALQAGALGCVNVKDENLTKTLPSLGGNSINIIAKSPPRVNDNPFSDGYWQANTEGMFDTAGNLVGGDNAACTSRDSLAEGRYIIVQVSYRQNLWLFGTRNVKRDATVVSHNLREI